MKTNSKRGGKAVSKLGSEPYKRHVLSMYDNLNNVEKYRKNMVKIENEISKFNGIRTVVKRPDYIGFYEHIRKYYIEVNNTTIEPRYKSILDYTYGEEPQVLYFMMLYVKRINDLEQFDQKYTEEDLQKDKRLAEHYLELYNEWKLLFGLLEKLDNLVLAVINSYDSSKIQHLDEDIKDLDSLTIKHRFLAAVARREKTTAFKLLGKLRNLDEGEDYYLEALAHYNNEEYEAAVRCAQRVNPGEIDYPAASAMIMECFATMGDFLSFFKYFGEIKQRISGIYIIYLLQTLICNANIDKLDEEELQTCFGNEIEFANKSVAIEDDALIGKVYRNFVNIALEGIDIVDDILYHESLIEEVKIPDRIQSRLEQLSLALDLYHGDISKFINLDYARENGIGLCREEIIEWTLSTLIYNNPDKSFENTSLALMALLKLGFVNDYIYNIEENLTDLEKFGANGDNRAYELISLAYVESSLSGRKSDKLFEALKRANINMDNAENEVKAKKVISILSDKGRIAYSSAEWQYNKAMEEDYGWKDAGMLSLSYFRILEVEFNQKMVLPLLSLVSINDLETKYNLNLEKLSGKAQNRYRTKWEILIKEFKKIVNPGNPTNGLMLGPLEYFVKYLGSQYDNNDEIANVLYKALKNILNEEGMMNLQNKNIEKMLSHKNREQFRNPPAHTRYLPFEKALECRTFVNESILSIGGWIK